MKRLIPVLAAVSAGARSVEVSCELDRETVTALQPIEDGPDGGLQALAEPINTRALAQRVPAFANLGDTFARAGGLFDYSRDPKEAFQSVARLLKKILGGAATAGAAARRRTRASVTECLRIYRRAIRRRKTAPY